MFTSHFPLTSHLCPSCSSSSTEGMGMQPVHNCSSLLLLLLHAFACCNVSPSHVLQDKVALEWALHQMQFLFYHPASTGPPLLWCLATSFPDFGVFIVLSNTSFPLFSLVFWAFLKCVIIRGTTSMAAGLSCVPVSGVG